MEAKEKYSHELDISTTAKSVSNQPPQKITTPSSQNQQKSIIEPPSQPPNIKEANQIQKSLIDNIKLSSNESLHNLGKIELIFKILFY